MLKRAAKINDDMLLYMSSAPVWLMHEGDNLHYTLFALASQET